MESFVSEHPLTLQSMIATILRFWSEQGCVIHQGYDLEVGAGTFNPATFLRALGPEPYKAAYVEPSRRPQDGRYGVHPNRLQNYHQLQVILKPVPENFLSLYTESLRAIGLDLRDHDIRFIHDDWENPTIGAWGLGWEVWLNGMEITQLTYFQAIGSKPLDTISGEITYGIERIAMYLQKKISIYDVLWNDTLTYGQITQASEKAWSEYNFDYANTEMWFKHFEDFAEEALRTLKNGLSVPAYDFVIKASHAFNILDARGTISVTERTRYIARIRQLTRLVADSYVEWRASLNYPLLSLSSTSEPKETSESVVPMISSTEDLLLEIGSEELPATFVPIGIQQLESLARQVLTDHNIVYEGLEVLGSPRRLALLVKNVAPEVVQKAFEKKGPMLTSLFSPDGDVSPQGQQFFASQGVDISHYQDLSRHASLAIRTVNGSEYLFLLHPEIRLRTADILMQELPLLIQRMKFPKKMVWDNSGVEYARPIRWLVALYGEHILPITLGTIIASRNSFGHRQLDPRKISISSPQDYVETLRQACVVVSQKERRMIIEQGLRAHSSDTISAIPLPRLIEEATFLSEHPFVSCGQFSEQFCALPKELLIAEMVNHQKYFPTHETSSGAISNFFIVVCDNSPNDTIIEGNEKALTPRLTDGEFLFKQDLQTPLTTFIEKLKSVTYFEALGSLYDKVERLKAHQRVFSTFSSLAASEDLDIAIQYCKADLVSAVVNEFPELQGIMGEYYLKHANLPTASAVAVGEHLRHITMGQKLSTIGTLLSLLDRLDNLLACFILGLKPTSSHDPYALRRQSLEVLTLVSASRLPIDLASLLDRLADHFPSTIEEKVWDKSKTIHEILEFIWGRLKTFMGSLEFRKDEIAAVLIDSATKNPIEILDTAEALQLLKEEHTEKLAVITTTHNRLKKILSSLKLSMTSSPIEVLGDRESNFKQVLDAFPGFPKETSAHAFLEYFLSLADLSNDIQDFLNTVHIANDDGAIRNLRISLLLTAMDKFSLCHWESVAV
ncbi:Glycine--tRNA ligase [Chlamydia pneumoniae]|uniref:Multifunctional fusion protein n=2 Tax=Chlamydia pneumoniae TaxID=83558 RepID=A0A0F7XH06_CHLPN|nr:Glycyl tRNA Synthetase [Chlamydia pneumoniae CWL029]CRI33481.1 Glycine--tRNA ligase [Chlamydia pneumoniae]CRI37470.1 Glycine--tRNA ligase [Chlamydia pneumoniae]CRI38602.1 Glycine--tRNA ligase [Chlamydia pneumoniae]CRI39733.1 Glycine--tRNA ligase [Chlamydia pneumoniae]